MFGLLGGLLGGALRGGLARGGLGGGALRGLIGRRQSQGGSSMPTYGGRAPQAVEQPQAESSAPPPPSEAPRQQESPPQQPNEQPMVQEAGAELQAAQAKSPVHGLLDDTKPAAPPPPADTDRPPQPPSIVNRTQTSSPVAPQQSETLGFIPQVEKTDTLPNALFEAANHRTDTPFQSGLPDKTFDTSGSDWTPSLGMQYQQSTTVAGSAPGRRYRSA